MRTINQPTSRPKESARCAKGPMNSILKSRRVRPHCRFFAFCAILSVFLLPPLVGASDRLERPASDQPDRTSLEDTSQAQTDDGIPAGTILPVRLPSISSKHLKPGDNVKGEIAQEVRLSDGTTIRPGTPVLGKVVSVTSANGGHGATLTLTFDRLVQRGRSASIRTNLRALASTLEVEQAQLPTSGPGESDVYDWLTTQQVGGDSVYGKQGPVVGRSGTVGESTYRGVFVRVLASADGRCRGAVGGDDRPQAVWVFSADACGLYGFPDLTILRAGRTEPAGEIALESKRGPVKIRSGSGALLRIVGHE
jgi:hypothetical protein